MSSVRSLLFWVWAGLAGAWLALAAVIAAFWALDAWRTGDVAGWATISAFMVFAPPASLFVLGALAASILRRDVSPPRAGEPLALIPGPGELIHGARDREGRRARRGALYPLGGMTTLAGALAGAHFVTCALEPLGPLARTCPAELYDPLQRLVGHVWEPVRTQAAVLVFILPGLLLLVAARVRDPRFRARFAKQVGQDRGRD